MEKDMEKDKTPQPPVADDDNWIEDLLKSPELGKEIKEDTHAEGIGLSPISDLELEKIIQETMSDDWDVEANMNEPVLDPEVFKEEGDTSEEDIRSIPIYYTDDGEMPPAEELVPQETPVVEEEEEYEDEPEEPSIIPRKVRPRRKKGYGLFGLPHLAATAIWLAICLFIGVSLGRLIWVCATDILAFGRDNHSVTITITEDDNLESIIAKLKSGGMIKYPTLFRFYSSISKAEEKISVGTFELNTQYDYHALVGGMSATSSYRQKVKVTIPEGYTCAQIFALLEEKGVCSVSKLEDYAANGTIQDRWFLDGVKRGDKYCLEGFLSPDTYEFYTNDTPQRVLGKFLNAFGAKMDSLAEDAQNQLAELNSRLSAMMKRNGYSQEYIDSHQLTFRDVVIVASMIEKETASNVESYTISAVIYNRLTNPDYPNLQIDATVVYALGGKKDLTTEDLQIDHPYNTYKCEGLPPGPISNPGLYSFYAALDPDEDPYYYYALDPSTNLHHFSKTYREHLDFLESIR